MNPKGDEPMKNEPPLQVHPAELTSAIAELKQRLPEIQAAVRRLEEAKIVSQETMQREVSI